MNSVPENSQETDDLALRFLRVFEESFRRLAMQQRGQTNVPNFKHLPVNQMRALHVLRSSPGLAQKALAQRLDVTPAAISTTVREMEKQGLVERHADPSDARQMCLYLTEEAGQMIAVFEQFRVKAVANLLAALPITEQRTIVEALERAMRAEPSSMDNDPPVREC
jgi:DNA-binding MarR family transcriptional regulator